jgi:hypothetical protein
MTKSESGFDVADQLTSSHDFNAIGWKELARLVDGIVGIGNDWLTCRVLCLGDGLYGASVPHGSDSKSARFAAHG